MKCINSYILDGYQRSESLLQNKLMLKIMKREDFIKFKGSLLETETVHNVGSIFGEVVLF